ncbi:MAG: DUF5991 domain-containing protein [Patescibacteria group bacterium]
MIIKQGKTNIKYLLIVVVLAVIVGGGILFLQYRCFLPPGGGSWVGTYKYEEFAPSDSGSDQLWVYKLSISYSEDYEPKLSIDGFQTMTKIEGLAKESNGRLDIFFKEYLPLDTHYESALYNEGDLLFSLKKINDSNYKIIWGKLKSNLVNPSVEAVFKKISPFPEALYQTVNWKTYRNEEYEFKYPSEFSLKEGKDTSELNYQSGIIFSGPGLRNDRVSLSFYTHDNPELLNLYDYITKKYGEYYGKEDYLAGNEYITWINDKGDAIDTWKQSLRQDLDGFGSQVFLQNIQNLDTVIVVYFNTGSKKEAAENDYIIYNQIISTFRFLEEKEAKGNSVYISEEKEDNKNILTFDINFHDYNIETREVSYPGYTELMGDKNLIFSPFYFFPSPPSVKIEKSNGVVFGCKPIFMQGIKITISYPLNSDLNFSLIDKKEEKLKEKPNLVLQCTYNREYCGPCIEEEIEDKLFPENPILYDYKKVVDNLEEYTAIVTLIRHNPITNETYILNEAQFKAIISSGLK